MVCGIYSYRDIKNDFQVIYIGQSKDIYKRHRQHLVKSARNQQPINRVLQSDVSRYSLQVEMKCTKEQLDSFEQLFISAYNPKFNFTKGGSGERIKKSKNGRYTLWDTSKAGYINSNNQRRTRPFRLYYQGKYIGGCVFEDWITIYKIHELIEEAIE